MTLVELQRDIDTRILVLSPTGRDAQLISETLSAGGLTTAICKDATDLVSMLEEAAAAAIIAEEGLSAAGLERLFQFVHEQPPWSDMPFVVLSSAGRPSRSNIKRAQDLQVLGNVTFLERPVRPDTVRSSVRAGLRARLRQYEMRRRQETLVRVNADLEQFAYSASHDLQEPLRNVAIYSELLSKRYSHVLDTQGQEFLGFVRSGAVHMEALVRDLLSYTQAASINDERPEPTDVGAALAQAMFNLKDAAQNSGCIVTHGVLPRARIRDVHLRQVLQNLIGNAIKYRREETPKIHITATLRSGFWVLAVADNGIGIEPEFKERVFGIFKRLHTRDKYPGTGIGLAICQRIAERYGGRIWVESTLGAGSTFYITVPC